jgi:hypothetical protein
MARCLLVASVGRAEDGGDWRDRVTPIASERLRGESAAPMMPGGNRPVLRQL